MKKIGLKYRTWIKGVPPRPIKLEISGWSGENRRHDNGTKPQPWHCPLFLDASTYGLELVYPFETECRVSTVDEKVVFDGDWNEERKKYPDFTLPPFQAFAPGHFGFTSSFDIQAPADHVIRIEPHPRFYTDMTHSCPLPVAGHIQSEWWPKIFFVVFKAPMPGQTYVFRKGEAYAQILVIPRRVSYQVDEMTEREKAERMMMEDKIKKCSEFFITNKWVDHLGNGFDDKYRQLSTAYAKGGMQGVHDLLNVAIKQKESEKEVKEKANRSRLGRRIVKTKRKNETLQAEKEKGQETCPFRNHS